jgi:hypothetical protein
MPDCSDVRAGDEGMDSKPREFIRGLSWPIQLDALRLWRSYRTSAAGSRHLRRRASRRQALDRRAVRASPIGEVALATGLTLRAPPLVNCSGRS